jgi:hypothetical protein
MFPCAQEGAPLGLVGGLLVICSVSAGPGGDGVKASPACCPAPAASDATPAAPGMGGSVPFDAASACSPTTGSVTGPARSSGVGGSAATTALGLAPPPPDGRRYDGGGGPLGPSPEDIGPAGGGWCSAACWWDRGSPPRARPPVPASAPTENSRGQRGSGAGGGSGSSAAGMLCISPAGAPWSGHDAGGTSSVHAGGSASNSGSRTGPGPGPVPVGESCVAHAPPRPGSVPVGGGQRSPSGGTPDASPASTGPAPVRSEPPRVTAPGG